MSAAEALARIGQSREALEEFVEAMHVAEDAVRELQARCMSERDRQVFETMSNLITQTHRPFGTRTRTPANSSVTISTAPRGAMTAAPPSTKIGTTLAHLIAFRKAVDDAMVAVSTVRDLVPPASYLEGAWDTVIALMGELSSVFVHGHPCWAEYCDLDLGY
jgi:hypothetical protein